MLNFEINYSDRQHEYRPLNDMNFQQGQKPFLLEQSYDSASRFFNTSYYLPFEKCTTFHLNKKLNPLHMVEYI